MAATGDHRLLVVTHNYPRFEGDPAGAFVARLARGAAAAGWAVRVVAPHAPGLAERSTEEGVELVRFRYAPDPMEVVAYSGELHRKALRNAGVGLMLPVFLVRFKGAVARAIREHRPDVIHAHWWLPSGLVVDPGTIPLVVTSHGSDVRLLDRAVFRWLAARVLARAALVTTVSTFLANALRRAVPSVADRVEVAPMPVDVERWDRVSDERRPDPPVVLYAGNLLPSKGVDVLLDAAALLTRDRIPFRLRILGEGPSRPDLEAQARRLGLEVSWSHFVTQEAMVAEYGAATTVVLPTRGDAEGLGLVLVEGTLAGCAAIGARSGGIPDVIEDGVTGRLVPPDDAGALAGAIAESFDPERRAAWIAEGRRRAMIRFGAGGVVAAFLDRYDRVRRRSR